jgi:L-ascorbate metabolism protein UlaG (beta-lactamase superfamily)
MALLPAKLRDHELVREIDQYTNDDKHFHLWWLGQSGFLLLWNGIRVLIDPYLSDSLTEKYASTDKPHIRMSERVIDPSLLQNISIVTSSHNHTDHLDAGTLIPVLKINRGISMIIPEANRQFVTDRIRKPLDFPKGLDAGESITLGEFTIHGVPACHNQIEKDENGRCKFMGYIFSFGKWKIYHSGDTLMYDEMIETLKPFAVDVAILPINGNDPARRVAGNLDVKEAAELGRAISARVVIPCHYDMFTFNTADPADFVKQAEKIGQPYKVLPPGGHFSSEMLP